MVQNMMRGVLLAAVIAIFAAPAGWLSCLVAAAAGAAITAWYAQRKLGGYTGDVLGAVQQVAEVFALALIAAAVTEPAVERRSRRSGSPGASRSRGSS